MSLVECIQYAYSAFNTSSDAFLILYFAASHLQKIRWRFETMTWYEKGENFVILNWVGNLKKNKKKTTYICMVAKHSAPASIVPFIKAFKPNMKLMHDIHIWPTDIHISWHFEKSWWTTFKSSHLCFIPEISIIANWDKGEHFTQANKTRHNTPHNVVLKSYFP